MDKVYKKQFDGLRFFLFLGIFIYHNDPYRFWNLSYTVAVFFVLSGYLITNILFEYKNQDRWGALKSFYVRRFLRILPAYYLLVIVLTLFHKLPYAGWHFAYLSNVKLFLMSLTSEIRVLDMRWQDSGMHLWSLCIEEQYYLLYPVFFLFTPAKWRMHFLAGLLFLSVATRCFFEFVAPRSYYGALLPVYGEYLLWGGLFRCLDAKDFFKKVHPSILFYSGVALVLVLVLSLKRASIVPQFHPDWTQTVWAIAISLCIYGLWKNDSLFVSKILSFKLFIYLGKISYGLYLYHLFTWQLADFLMLRFPGLQAAGLFCIRLGLTLAIAMLSWHLFEGPINRYRKKMTYSHAY